MTNKHYKPLLIESVKANADLIEHRFVGFNGKHCGAGAKAFGVVDVSTEQEQFAPAAVCGILLVEAGGTIALGDAIASDENGKAVKAESTAIINGYACDAGVTGHIIRVLRGI